MDIFGCSARHYSNLGSNKENVKLGHYHAFVIGYNSSTCAIDEVQNDGENREKQQ